MRLGYIAGILYLGVLATAFAFKLYFGIIRVIGPVKAAYSSVLIPVIAMLFSTAFEGYRWTPLALGGGLLTLIGLVVALRARRPARRSEEHTSELQSLMRISYAVFCLKKKK